MLNVKCADCAEYRNEWCEKVIDSPYPDILRDCQYYHEKDRDLVRVVMCKDCKNGMYDKPLKCYWCKGVAHSRYWFCADGERSKNG